MTKEWVGLEGVVSGPLDRAAMVRLTGVRVGTDSLIIFYYDGSRQGACGTGAYFNNYFQFI